MSEQSNDNNSKYIFHNLPDAIVYFIISVIYPIYSTAIEYYSAKHINEPLDDYVLFSLIAGSVFFYATYAYDFSIKFYEAENKKKGIFQFLIICAFFYSLLAVISLILLMVVFNIRPDGNLLLNIVLVVFIVSSIPCLYPIVEIISRIKAQYMGKISRAAV